MVQSQLFYLKYFDTDKDLYHKLKYFLKSQPNVLIKITLENTLNSFTLYDFKIFKRLLKLT